MTKRAIIALAAGLLPLIAACTPVPPTAVPLPEQTPLTSPTQAPEVTPEVTPEPLPSTPTATPVGTPMPQPSATPSKSPTAKPSRKPSAKPSPSSTAPEVKAEACADTTIRYLSKGACARKAQQLLKDAGMYSPKPGNTFGAAAVNWTLTYQRSRGIADTGVIGPETWAALLTKKGRLPERIPASCRTPGVVICTSKAQNKLYWLKDGQIKKTISVRFGGWTTDRKGKWRLHPTVNGTYRVYRKHVNPPSERYGRGAMPYSTMFDPNMYVHYSAPFAKQGYSGSSHGCVNVRSRADAKWVMDNTPIGAKVVVYAG